ncbi:MAG: glycine oxidase ThiO [Candidatus Acidiferrales bacterium]
MPRRDIIIVGGGVIGCSLALELARAAIPVQIVERGEPGREASWAAAGMLAPSGEFVLQDQQTRLARASAALYPEWLARLRELSSIDVGHRTEGTLQLAFSEAEARELDALPGERISGAEARRLEPALSENVAAAVYLRDDHQVDNRRLLEALVEAAGRAGVVFRTGVEVRELLIESGRARGVRTAEGTVLEAGAVVNAAGSWAGTWGEAARRLAPTRPVRGQMLAVRGEASFLRHIVRSPRGYIVPRDDGRLLLGSTMEDAGYDKSVTPEALRRLLAGAREIVPAVAALPYESAWAGLRPDTPDHLPILGATDIENFFIATGHFRNGILLAPITAKLMTEVILGRPPSISLEPFSPLRFRPPR